jgi:hypothetical protein
MKKYAALFLILFLCSSAFADNDYFEASTYQITPGSTARSSQINNITNALETGLDKLPSESNIKNGLINYGTDSGAADAYVVTMPYTPTAYTDGMLVAFKADNVNTGACTVNVDSLGAKSIKRQDGSAPIAGDIAANKIVELRYNSTSGYFEIQGSIGATAGAGTMSLQNANAVAITGGTASGLTLTSPVLNGTLSGTAFLDEDDMASNSAAAAFSQQSLVSYITSGSVTMASKTLTSPVLNGTLSGTAFLDEDDMASNSAVAAVSQQSLINYLASGSVTFSNKNFSQSGTVTITDTGNTGLEEPLKLNAPNLSSSGDMRLYLGVEDVSKNEGTITFYYAGDGSTSNFLSFGIYGVDNYLLRLDGSGNVGIGASSDGDKLYVSGTGEYIDTLTLSKASGNGLVVTSNVDFNGNEDLVGTLDIGSGTTRRVAPAGTFVSNANGNPNISDTALDLDSSLAHATWESVGPTGSGADNTWTALNSVPADADWVELKVYLAGVDGGASTTVNSTLSARANGSSESAGSDNFIGVIGDETDGSGNAHAFCSVSHKVPVSSSIIFDLYFSKGFTTNVGYIYLAGWGFNP